jgi:hypothetical protein
MSCPRPESTDPSPWPSAGRSHQGSSCPEPAPLPQSFAGIRLGRHPPVRRDRQRLQVDPVVAGRHQAWLRHRRHVPQVNVDQRFRGDVEQEVPVLRLAEGPEAVGVAVQVVMHLVQPRGDALAQAQRATTSAS